MNFFGKDNFIIIAKEIFQNALDFNFNYFILQEKKRDLCESYWPTKLLYLTSFNFFF